MTVECGADDRGGGAQGGKGEGGMTRAEHTAAEAAEARVAAFEDTLEMMLMGLRIMRQDGHPAAEIADRVTAAWQALGMSMTGRVSHAAPGRLQ